VASNSTKGPSRGRQKVAQPACRHFQRLVSLGLGAALTQVSLTLSEITAELYHCGRFENLSIQSVEWWRLRGDRRNRESVREIIAFVSFFDWESRLE